MFNSTPAPCRSFCDRRQHGRTAVDLGRPQCLFDRLPQLGRVRRDLAREEGDDFAVLPDEMYLLKFHCGRLPVWPRNEYTEDWSGPASGDDLREHRKRHTVILFAEGFDLGSRPWLLGAEVVAREAEHRETARRELGVELLEALGPAA